MREIDMITYYLPPFMQSYKEPVAALKAENPEFEKVWEETEKIMRNFFICTADEYGISRYEKLLGIKSSPTSTLEFRRGAVMSKWNPQIPLTMNGLKNKLTLLCGSEDGFVVTYDNDHYALSVKLALTKKEMRVEAERMVRSLTPENLQLDVDLLYNTYNFLASYKYGYLKAFTQAQLRDEPI